MLFILLVFFVKNIECVLAETNNKNISSVMFLPMNKLLALEDSGTDAVVQFVMVYEDGVAYIPCFRKPQRNHNSMFINKMTTELFESISQEEGRLNTEGSDIIIYHVQLTDAGIYKFGNSENETSVIVLEVITYEKSPLTLPNYNVGFEDENKLLVYSLWSPWSECSVCGEVGKKRRFGICYVKNKQGYLHTGTSRDVLETFEDGMPCRSQYLPQELRLLPALIMSRNTIEISQCKVACKHVIFEASLNGTVLERANNSAGIYSLKQPLPVEPCAPGREVVFAAIGQRLVVRCPGSVNRNIPLRWRVGQGWLETGSDRVHVSSRDEVIIETVTNEDANLYSCWAGRQLLGSVRVAAWGGAHQWDHHCALAALILVTTALLRAFFAMLRRIG